MTEKTTQAEDELNACFDEVQTLCNQRGLSLVRLAGTRQGWLTLQLQGTSQIWNLNVDCGRNSITRLPPIQLSPPWPLLAHVSYDGTVCVSDAQGLSLDFDRPAAVVAYTTLKAFDLLEKSAADAAAGLVEFYNELEGYWLGLPGSCKSRAAIEIDGKDRLVSVYVDFKSKHPKWYFTERDTSAPREFLTEKLAAQRGLYVHLNTPIEPPAPPLSLDAKFVEAVYTNLSPSQLLLWDKLVGPSKNGPKTVGLLVSVPRAAGGLSLIGMSFKAHRGNVDSIDKVRPLTVRRHTAAYMRERGGASRDLYGKHVVVFGCGAVGSEVADALAAAGVEHLTLVDPDIFSEDNVFRHVLAPMWIDVHKVKALELDFTHKYPGLKISSVPETAQEWLGKNDLNGVDGVVFALGLPTLERKLARQLRQSVKQVPLLFTWLEPLDIGGHSPRWPPKLPHLWPPQTPPPDLIRDRV